MSHVYSAWHQHGPERAASPGGGESVKSAISRLPGSGRPKASKSKQRDRGRITWLALTPPALVQGHPDVGDMLMKALRQGPGSVVKG